MILGLGLDLVDIPRMARILDGPPGRVERFVERVFTQGERAYCDARVDRASRYAARFAAKEAAIKALSLGHVGVDWRDIEVLRRDDGSCSLALHGRAQEAARLQGVSGALVCLSHDGEYAAAVVAALSDTAEPGA